MNIKIIEKLIKDFKKSNKERRLRTATKLGYESAEKYLEYLNNQLSKSVEVKSKSSTTTAIAKPKKIGKKPVLKVKTKEEVVDLVIAFDTTGSMKIYIESVKTHVKELIPELFKNTPNLKISIVAFGDYCDKISTTEFGNAYQVIGLTNNQNDLISFVTNAKNTGGGDSDEFYELVIKKITEETQWRDGKRRVLLIADDGPHSVGYKYKGKISGDVSYIDWRVEAKASAVQNIQWDTLTINQVYADWYKELSNITGGVSLPFKSANKTQEVIKAVTYSTSSSAASKAAFASSMESAIKSGDEELIGVYKSLSTLK